MPDLDPRAESSVAMTNEEWQVALSVLREAPYKLVAPIIEKIVGQCIAGQMNAVRDREVDAG